MARLSFILCYISYVLLFFVFSNIKCVEDKVTIFSKQTSCKLQSQFSLECVQLQDGVFISEIECASDCAKQDTCIGISSNRNSDCYHHKKCSQNITCENTDDIFTIYIKENNNLDKISDDTSTTSTTTPTSCENDGTWNSAADACKCSGGWVGRFCERHATNCNELSQYGYPQGWPDGLIWTMLKVDTYPKLIKVLCELEVTYVNTYIMRNSGWQRLISPPTQDDYTNGFYKSNEYFWLGLAKMKALNDVGHTRVNLDMGFSTSGQNLFQMIYTDFILGNISTGFNFTFTAAKRKQIGPESNKQTFGDCLTPLQGAQFYIPDQEPESPGQICAEQAGTGWWFPNCPLLCNPLGYKTALKADGPKTERIIMDGTDCENIDSCIVSMYFVT